MFASSCAGKTKLRARNYSFDLLYKPGTEISTADTLSRAPIDTSAKKEIVYNIILHRIRDQRLEQIRQATGLDADVSEVTRVISDGWPDDKQNLPAAAKPAHFVKKVPLSS